MAILIFMIQMDQAVLRIEGPFCRASCFGDDVEFPVFSAQTGEQVGLITKQWSGFAKEVKKILNCLHFIIFFLLALGLH